MTAEPWPPSLAATCLLAVEKCPKEEERDEQCSECLHQSMNGWNSAQSRSNRPGTVTLNMPSVASAVYCYNLRLTKVTLASQRKL